MAAVMAAIAQQACVSSFAIDSKLPAVRAGAHAGVLDPRACIQGRRHALRASVPLSAGRPHSHPKSARFVTKCQSPATGAVQKGAKPSTASDGTDKLAQVVTVLGSQWGDEGKGKLVDILAQKFDVVARCQGGANAGHTIYDTAGNRYALHLIPSGILNPKAVCLVANGGRLLVSDRAHLLFDFHKTVDGLREAELKGSMIGTTKRGIGPCYSAKATRNGLRVCDLYGSPQVFREKLASLCSDYAKRFGADFVYDLDALCTEYAALAERFRPYVVDSVTYINDAVKAGKKVLVEGANATMLDLDFGTYPFVTSSNPSIGGICTGLGLAPSRFGDIIGVAKAYTTRVGSGPYPTEELGATGETLRKNGHEFGTTTGRPRRCGWLDVVALRYAGMINGFTSLNLTKLDVLSGFPTIKIGVGYVLPDGTKLPSVPANLEVLEKVKVDYEIMEGWTEDISKARSYTDLPKAARAYVERVEELVGIPITWIGVGPGRDAIITKH
eukprot:jgi/Mesvir1/10776/Mv13836-RA.1